MMQLVVVGGGIAAIAAVEHVVKSSADVEITMFSEEPQSRRDAAGSTEHGSSLDSLAWYQQNGVRLQLGLRVVEIDAAGKTVTADDGSITPYDTLLLATKATVYVPPIIGIRKRNVFIDRKKDSRTVTVDLARGSKVVVLADTLEGLDASRSLLAAGYEVYLALDTAPILRHNLDANGARFLIRKVERLGIPVISGKRVTALVGNGRVECVDFEDGTELPADAVVIPAAVRPDIDLARRAGLQVDEGIIVNDMMQTSDRDVFAVGECAEHRQVVYSGVRPSLDQAYVAANVMLGRDSIVYEGSLRTSSARVLDVDIFAAGQFDEASTPGAEVVRYEDPALGIYKKLVLINGTLAGAVLIGDVSAKAMYTDWIRDKTDVSSMRRSLLFPAQRVV
jgi:nitrite reductase (NADH) large subunit